MANLRGNEVAGIVAVGILRSYTRNYYAWTASRLLS